MSVFTFSDLAFMGVAAGAGIALDPDAAAYITAVETQDGQALEAGVRTAINDFVIGCKADGIWGAIKACCIMAGARTLNGALVPLVGTAPTRFGTEGGWNYNRKTGIQGNGTNNYLNSNRNNNADPQNNHHMAAYMTAAGVTNHLMGTAFGIAGDSAIANGSMRSRGTGTSFAFSRVLGFNGMSRSASSDAQFRQSGTTSTVSGVSATPGADAVAIFSLGPAGNYGSSRVSFYSIGESLVLALLDARVTALINAFAAAIP